MSDQIYIKSIEDDNDKLRARNSELEVTVQKQEEELKLLRPKPQDERIRNLLETQKQFQIKEKKLIDSFKVGPYRYEEEKDEVNKKGVIDRIKSMFGMK